MRDMTKRQSETLQAIIHFINEHGVAPTYRELMKHLGLSSTSTVKGHLDKLKEKNYITWQNGCPRTLKLEKRAQQF
ncbi:MULTISPECIES: LexA family protein [Bacillus]|nr:MULTISPECIES: transcriptional regulator [Bacillus]MCP1460221.1 repressor LexA [Bacillus amyloliquefaciens]MCU9590245.1 transcriptional regulator [Bacillus velezensis]MDU0077784.1 transcriptional regulator [Bacillus sp. IG2]MDU0102967.1 transcriptional regulator [Bacillus sp. IS1]MDV2630090.1 transcriptional regulator [Bacillus velezensis]